MKSKSTHRHLLAIAANALVTMSAATAQTIYDWKDDAPDGNWRQGAAGARWYNNSNFDNLWDEPPTSTGAILRFNNNHQLTMTNNVSGTYNIHGLIFGSSNTSARTINGGTIQVNAMDVMLDKICGTSRKRVPRTPNSMPSHMPVST